MVNIEIAELDSECAALQARRGAAPNLSARRQAPTPGLRGPDAAGGTSGLPTDDDDDDDAAALWALSLAAAAPCAALGPALLLANAKVDAPKDEAGWPQSESSEPEAADPPAQAKPHGEARRSSFKDFANLSLARVKAEMVRLLKRVGAAPMPLGWVGWVGRCSSMRAPRCSHCSPWQSAQVEPSDAALIHRGKRQLNGAAFWFWVSRLVLFCRPTQRTRGRTRRAWRRPS